jgi:sensor histidine kinase YesM
VHPILKEKTGLALYLVSWTLIGMLLALVIAQPERGGWLLAAALAVPLTVLYAFIGLAARYVCQANPLPQTPMLRALGSQLAAGILSSGLWLALGSAWARLLAQLPALAAANDLYRQHIGLFFAAGVLLYLLAAALHYLLLAYEASQRAQQQALELEVLAREAELQAFRTQIDPHFLFNCLNSISSLCGTDPEAARHTAVRLGDFLRASLRWGSDDTIALAEELQLCSAYLDVERVRFGDRLRYEQQVADDALDVQIPALLLQPLLENALKHGIAHLIEGGDIRMACSRAGEFLEILVRNHSDATRPSSSGTGIGLANVRGRLELLYGSRASLETLESDDSFEVEIRIPIEDER